VEHFFASASIFLIIVLTIGVEQQRRLMENWKARAQATQGYMQELMDRLRMLEIEKFLEYLKMVKDKFEEKQKAKKGKK